MKIQSEGTKLPQTEQKNSTEHTFFKTSDDSAPSSGRYTPTCNICGKQHWPLDPSCLGKKGAKAKAKANALAKAEAKRQAKLQAKAERKSGVKAPKNARHAPMDNDEADFFAEKISRIRSEARLEIAKIESHAEDTLQAKQRKWSKIQAQSEQRIQARAEEIERVKSEMAQAVSKEQEKQKEWAEEKQKIREEADDEIKKITDMLIGSKEALRAEVEIRVSIEKQLVGEISKRRQLEAEALEKTKSHGEETAKLRSLAADSKTITEAQLKEKLQEELKLRTMLQTEVSAKIKSFVKQISSLKAEAARSQQENQAKAANAEIDNIVFEENDASLTIDTDVSGNITSSLLAIKARDIMLREIVWTDPDDSVRDVFEKMHTSGDHVIVGTEGIAAGIVSKDSLKGIASSYLQPLMSKWKQDRNDASLDIEIKWLMNRQMQTVSEDTSCTAIMKKMHSGSGALPVVDQDNHVLGLVTPYNVLKVRALLKLESISAQQKLMP